MLILVRHAMPAYEQSIPPNEWPLSPDGVSAARSIALPPGAYLAASDEQKAWQTIEHAGTVVRDRRFGEVRREGEPWDGPFRELRRSYVEGTDHTDWEPRAAVAARFEEGILDYMARAAGRPLVVASHGMAMTIWLTARIGLPSPGDFWAELTFPDVVEVDLTGRTVRRSGGDDQAGRRPAQR